MYKLAPPKNYSSDEVRKENRRKKINQYTEIKKQTILFVLCSVGA